MKSGRPGLQAAERYGEENEKDEEGCMAMNGEGYFAGQDSLLCVTVQTNGKNRENRIQESLRRAVAFRHFLSH